MDATVGHPAAILALFHPETLFMAIIQIVFLAFVQGVGEFLPISSSGHVLVVASLFEWFGSELPEDKLTLNIVLHLGTLAAILVFYRRRIWRLLGSDRRVIGPLIVGTIPAVVIGVPLDMYCGQVLQNPLLAGFMFLATGGLLLWSATADEGTLSCRDLTLPQSLVIGLYQAFAILPGVSRSGSTIVAGISCGLKRDEAATFSFLLAIPVIGGAGLLKLVKLAQTGSDGTEWGLLALGALVSFCIGLGALWWLVKWLQQGRLHLFAYWVIPLGLAVIIWQLVCP